MKSASSTKPTGEGPHWAVVVPLLREPAALACSALLARPWHRVPGASPEGSVSSDFTRWHNTHANLDPTNSPTQFELRGDAPFKVCTRACFFKRARYRPAIPAKVARLSRGCTSPHRLGTRTAPVCGGERARPSAGSGVDRARVSLLSPLSAGAAPPPRAGGRRLPSPPRPRGGRGGARVGAPSYTLQRDGQFYFNACLLCAHNHTADGAHGHTEPPGANYIYPTARRPTAWGLANDGGTVVGAGFASPRRSRASRSE